MKINLVQYKFQAVVFLLKTDASKSGWGAIFGKETTCRKFALDELLLHINALKLKAVLFGLKSLCM